MKNRNRDKIYLVISILFIFIFSSSFKKHKDDMDQSPKYYFFQQDLKTLNEGRLFRYQSADYSTDQILVKFKTSLSEQRIEATIASYTSKNIKRIPRINVYQVQIPPNVAVEEMIFGLQQNPDVEYVEPDYRAHITATPNDILFRYQYSLYNSGQEIGPPGSPQGKSRADIKATAGWEETKGSNDITIAIVDTGVDLRHPDLKNKCKSSGYDFVNDDFDATDDNGHGTHVAGIAAAETNNGEGIAGTVWNCNVLPVKVMDEEGSGLYSWVIQGIIWAADRGANVINLSLGGDAPAQSLLEAIKYAYQKGVVISAAAGSDASAVVYPAAYDNYCLAVASTDYNDLRPDWSAFGPEVDIAAPGDRILSLVPTWYWGPNSLPYGFASGTSMSTAYVSGLAALIAGLKPWLTAGEIMNVIRFSSDDVNSSEYPGKDDFIGYGRINTEKALVPIKIK